MEALEVVLQADGALQVVGALGDDDALIRLRFEPTGSIALTLVRADAWSTASVEAANTDVAPFFEHVVRVPHSVVTAHLIDEAGEPTAAARDEMLAFFAQRLAAT